jgi:hypothetical protein
MPKHAEARSYPLSMSDAATITELNPAQLRSYVGAGLLPCLIERGTGDDEWFNPDDLAELHQLLEGKADADKERRRAIDAAEGLRLYLEAHPPLIDYDRAIETRSPVLARSRAGKLHAHVQSGAVAQWLTAHHPELPTAGIEPTLMQSLSALGAARIRGITPATGGPQRWQYWYRLPLHVWSASPDLESLVVSMGSAREDGETVVQRGGQPAHLTTPMRLDPPS